MSMSAADLQALQGMYDSAGALQAKQISQQYKLGKDEIAARLKIAAQSSKDTRYGIDAERDTAREQIAQAQAQMERVGIPEMEIKRFVAESTKALAEAELALKRDQFLVDTRQKDAQLQLDREQMERVGIPQMEINRYIAEKSAEMDRLTFGEGQRQYNTTFGEGQRQFDTTFGEGQRQYNTTFGEGQRQYNTTASGYLQSTPQLTAQQQARLGQLQARDGQLKAAGVVQGVDADQPGASAELYQLLDIQAGRVANPALGTGGPGGGPGGLQATLDREKFQQDQLEQARRYGLDVSKFGAELASTPDTYFQARRFQGVDVPRLLGGAGAQTSAPTGGPTPGVATMGSYLSGQDPYATPYGGRAAGGPVQYSASAAGGDGGFSQYMSQFGMPENPQAAQAMMTQRRAEWDAMTPEQKAPFAPAASGTPSRLGMPGTPYDDRDKQIAGIAKLVPPSPYDGLDDTDTNALKLMEGIYKKGGNQIAGGEYERLQASGRLGYLQSAGKLLGFSPSDLENDYMSYRPAQSAANLAG